MKFKVNSFLKNEKGELCLTVSDSDYKGSAIMWNLEQERYELHPNNHFSVRPKSLDCFTFVVDVDDFMGEMAKSLGRRPCEFPLNSNTIVEYKGEILIVVWVGLCSTNIKLWNMTKGCFQKLNGYYSNNEYDDRGWKNYLKDAFTYDGKYLRQMVDDFIKNKERVD